MAAAGRGSAWWWWLHGDRVHHVESTWQASKSRPWELSPTKGGQDLRQARRGASAGCRSSRPSSLSFLICRPASTDTLAYMAGAARVSCCGEQRDRAGGVVRLGGRYPSPAREELPCHPSSHAIDAYPVPPPNPAAAGKGFMGDQGRQALKGSRAPSSLLVCSGSPPCPGTTSSKSTQTFFKGTTIAATCNDLWKNFALSDKARKVRKVDILDGVIILPRSASPRNLELLLPARAMVVLLLLGWALPPAAAGKGSGAMFASSILHKASSHHRSWFTKGGSR